MRSPEEHFAAVVDDLLDEPGVTPPGADAASGRKFGSNGLKVHNKIFAMLVGGHLVVKLPAERVAELIAAGKAEPFDAGKGRPMKEWATLQSTSDEAWLQLAREALDFVRPAHS
jgi:TfoX/Sxy family transcriptional regulator of competence genes